MDTLVKIKDKDGLVRDMSSGAILNTNTTEFANYIRRKNNSEEIRNQINNHAEQINNIKTDITEIKQMLIALINKES